MGVAFFKGKQLGPDDLDICLTNSSGTPTNAAEISYSLHDVTTGAEVLLGAPRRSPANPETGKYYASLIIPLDANIGLYRVRWTFRETAGGPVHQAVQEFEVIDKEVQAPGLSSCSVDMVRRLRIMLRDNCVGGEELVELDVDGEIMLVSMQDLWSLSQGDMQIPLQGGKIRVRSLSPKGDVEWKFVEQVHRFDVRPESIWELVTEWGTAVVTGGHRVYISATDAVDAETLKAGDRVMALEGGQAVLVPLTSVRQVEDRTYMYDLTVADNHNLFLHRSRIVAHNSPDRNYHFRPPAHEATINQYNQVFGYVWEDYELAEFIERAVDMIAAAPPRTPFGSCDALVGCKPEWRTLMLTGAAYYALMALQINWIVDEFSYSIGGVSLDVEKSSKYESAAGQFKDTFSDQLEKAKATVKIVSGLQQPRYGIGIRSSFGPYAGRGQITPAKWVGF